MYFSMPTDWRCCAYLRKSREDEERERYGKFETLARHREIVKEVAARNGHTISKWFEELQSGETIASRDAIKELLGELVAGAWDAVYVVEASRLGRGGGSDQEKIINAFRYTGTYLVTEWKVFDPESKHDMIDLKRELRSSEDELEVISSRLNRGKYHAAKEGVWQSTGKAPFGWKSARIQGKWTLEPDERHDDMLRIYDLLEQGIGLSGVSRIYNAEKVPTARGGYHWTPAAVRKIALNPVNCGMIYYAQRHVVREFDPDTFTVKKRVVKNDAPQVSQGLHFGRGGISVERWKKITEIIRSSPKLHEGKELVNPLASILVCGKCGYALNVTTGSKYGHRYFRHKSHVGMTRACSGCRGARLELVMDSFCDAMQEIAEDIAVKISSGGGADDYQRHIAALNASLSREHDIIRKAMDAFEAGVYSLEDLKTRKAAAEQRMTAIEREISEAKPPSYTPETLISIKHLITMIKEGEAPAQSINDLLKTIVKRVDYYNDTPAYERENRIRLEITML